MTDPYRICTRCIMDTTDPDIVFDETGVCNHCHRFDMLARTRIIPDEERAGRLAELVSEIQRAGKDKEYDCIIGVSGGVDSTYVAHLVKQWGLRPLAVHFDNGWNSELAVSNIENTLKRLDIDLFTYVVDWKEFSNLQLSFLRASTPDAEVPTDHAIIALLFRMAAKYRIRYILTGTNVATEAILPLKWGYGYFDYKYIRSVHRRFGSRPLRTYPHFSLAKLFSYLVLQRIKLVSVLNFIDYQKNDAMQTIEDELGWVYYGGKHYESIYTRFFQSYILPQKFNIDKRRAHYSTLVAAGQMTRDTAHQLMAEPTAPAQIVEQDREYAKKKLRLSEAEFAEIMNARTKTFEDYPTSYQLFEFAKKIVRMAKSIKMGRAE